MAFPSRAFQSASVTSNKPIIIAISVTTTLTLTMHFWPSLRMFLIIPLATLSIFGSLNWQYLSTLGKTYQAIPYGMALEDGLWNVESSVRVETRSGAR